MFGSVGFWELLVLFMLALVVFGPRRLPELGRSLGRAVGMFRRASQEFRETLEHDVAREQHRAPATRLPPGALPRSGGPEPEAEPTPTPASAEQTEPAPTPASAEQAEPAEPRPPAAEANASRSDSPS